MKFEAVVSCVALVGTVLQGCGGDGEKDGGNTTASVDTTAIVTDTTPTTTGSTTSWKPPPGPRDGKQLALKMNAEYNGYEEGNPDSDMGNWIRMDVNTDVFCGGGPKGCWEGKPDCRVTGSIYNHMQMINENGNPGGWFGFPSGKKLTGWYANSTLIKTKLAKCSYAWDGGTDGKLNNGCGCPAKGTHDCDDPESPWANNCDGETCTSDSPDVKDCWCGNFDKKNWPKDGEGSKCFWKGVAFDGTGDETHTMLDQRTEHQAGSGGPYNMSDQQAWNELVLDGELMLEALKEDPAGVIMAVVYSDDQLSIAQKMALEFQTKYGLDAPLPVLFLDTTVDARTGTAAPWVFNETDQPSSAVFA